MSVLLLLSVALGSGGVEGTVRNEAGPVRWAFVYVKRSAVALPKTKPGKPVVFRSEPGGYRPRVAGVRTGQEVVFAASEGPNHWPHLLPKVNPPGY